MLLGAGLGSISFHRQDAEHIVLPLIRAAPAGVVRAACPWNPWPERLRPYWGWMWCVLGWDWPTLWLVRRLQLSGTEHCLLLLHLPAPSLDP